jgi:Rrf2 family protein
MKRTGSTMQLTRAADYAVRAMVYFATRQDGERILLPELAKATSAPESFLSKVLQSLAKAGFIASRRGQSGGFTLLEKGRCASMREVIEAIDGPIYLNSCLISDESCQRSSWCPAHTVWIKAQEQMIAVLDQTMIAEMASSLPRQNDATAGE